MLNLILANILKQSALVCELVSIACSMIFTNSLTSHWIHDRCMRSTSIDLKIRNLTWNPAYIKITQHRSWMMASRIPPCLHTMLVFKGILEVTPLAICSYFTGENCVKVDWLFQGYMAGHHSCDAIGILIITFVVKWELLFYSWNVRHQEKMRKNSELKMEQPGSTIIHLCTKLMLQKN